MRQEFILNKQKNQLIFLLILVLYAEQPIYSIHTITLKQVTMVLNKPNNTFLDK